MGVVPLMVGFGPPTSITKQKKSIITIGQSGGAFKPAQLDFGDSPPPSMWHTDGPFGKDRSSEVNDMMFIARKRRGMGTDMR